MVKGEVRSGNNKATFGELAADAAADHAARPDSSLKDPAAFTIHRQGARSGKAFGRLDTADKVKARLTSRSTITPEGALTALLARSPKFGGKVASVDDAAAKAIPGVTDVVQISNGVAVVATNFWAAKKGREALKVTWDDAGAEKRSTDAMLADYRKLLDKPGQEARKEGKGAAALKGAGQVVTADFEFPYLVHAPMEPLNCTITYKPGESCVIHTGSQMPTNDQAAACAVLGLKPEQVSVTTTLAGGSFGRRATPDADLVTKRPRSPRR